MSKFKLVSWCPIDYAQGMLCGYEPVAQNQANRRPSAGSSKHEARNPKQTRRSPRSLRLMRYCRSQPSAFSALLLLSRLPFLVSVRGHRRQERFEPSYDLRIPVRNIVYLGKVGLQVVESKFDRRASLRILRFGQRPQMWKREGPWEAEPPCTDPHVPLDLDNTDLQHRKPAYQIANSL